MRKVMKGIRIIVIFLLCLSACMPVGCAGFQKYAYDIYSAFDTHIRIIGYAKSNAEFDAFAKAAHERLDELHRLFDIYHTYDSVNNLKTINDNAGIMPVKADPAIIDLLLLYKELAPITGGVVNPALGPVLTIWHEYRNKYSLSESGELPPMETLLQAAIHTNLDDVLIDEAENTVFLQYGEMKLDVGAAAKGFAIELVANELSGGSVQNFLINAGGDVVTRGEPPEGRPWSVGIQNPFPAADGSLSPESIHILYLAQGSAVTSGDYQRYYTVDGIQYNHIIDPATFLPASLYRSVTVTGPDCAVAEILSTALFILPYEQGRAIAEQMGYGAVWIMPDGEIRESGISPPQTTP